MSPETELLKVFKSLFSVLLCLKSSDFSKANFKKQYFTSEHLKVDNHVYSVWGIRRKSLPST